jgi:V/A-type H+-transporting ATPase subunit D
MAAENVIPTRMNLLARRAQFKLASDGLVVLRGKRDALLKELIARARRFRELQRELQERGRAAAAALMMARAVRGTPEVRSVALAGRRSLQVSVSYQTVWGVLLGSVSHGGIVRSSAERGVGRVDYSAHIFEAAEAAEALVEQLLLCAPLEGQIQTMGEEVRKVSRRINAIEEHLLPRLREEMQTITQVLDEREREDRFRLKRVKKKKAEAKKKG